MARAAYIVKKDGRYWFQKRFAAHVSRSRQGASHMRLALRTGDYHVAVRRMARVLDSVSEYEIQPDLVGRAEALMAQMRRFNTRLSAPGHDELVERRALELLVSRLIDEARWRDHPLTSDPPDFWHTWLVFAQGNQRFEEVVAQADHPPAATDRTGMALARVPSALRASTRVGSAVADMSAEHSSNSDAAYPMISEVRRAYLDQRRTKDGDGRAEEDAGIVLDFVVDFLGDRPMSSLSEREWFKIENALPDVPHPYGVPKEYTVSLHKRWQYAQAHGWGGLKRISKTRLKNGWHRSLHAFLTWAREKGFYAGPDYKFNLVSADNSEAQERDAWQPGEIVKLFSLPLFTGAKSEAWHWESGDVFVQNHLYWAYLLIFFAGLRPSEIGRTRLEDFALIEGVWYLDYRSKSERAKGASKVKKSASARLVPIPRLLI